MADFRLFPQLAPELRNRIWELTIESREVSVQQHEDNGVYMYWFTRAQIPGALQACRESRSALESFGYTKSFEGYRDPRYIWVNFDIDTIRIHDDNIKEFHDDRDLFQQLILESDDVDMVLYRDMEDFMGFAALRCLTIISSKPFEQDGDIWFEVVEAIEKEIEPPRILDVRMVDPTGEEINLANWRAREREWRHRQAKIWPDLYEISDSELEGS